MGNPNAPFISTALRASVRDGASAAQVAGEVAATWSRIEAALNPIIGTAGVVALFERSVSLASRRHAWMSELSTENQRRVDVAALTAFLASRESTVAALGGGEVLEIFCDLLGSLIGPTLTRRLLPFMWQSLNESVSEQRHD